jgi:hypothetical protein
MICLVCGEPFEWISPLGLIGLGGVCRDPYNPNQDDEGMHIVDDPRRIEHMSKFNVGDKVKMPDVPFVVEVLEVGTCTDAGCDEETFRYKDPTGMGEDWAHADEFVQVSE